MKKIILALSTLGLLIFTGSAQAGNDGGGGNITHKLNTKEQVSLAIDHSRARIFDAFLFPGYIEKDPDLAKVWDKMFGSDKTIWPYSTNYVFNRGANPFVGNVLATKIIKLTKGLCKDHDGNDSDASVVRKQLRAPICFSIPSLRFVDNRYLQSQVTSLLAHEVTHQYGFGEVEAKKVQDYVFRHFEYGQFFDYIGINVTTFKETDSLRINENTHITLTGQDAKTLYDNLEITEKHVGNDFDHRPRGLMRLGKNIECRKFDDPVPDYFRESFEGAVRTWDYECTLALNKKTGETFNLQIQGEHPK